jgi:hypothetical protein
MKLPSPSLLLLSLLLNVQDTGRDDLYSTTVDDVGPASSVCDGDVVEVVGS